MDDTHQSRVSDAAATRKRRSSILKTQRPPRAPFSELEFNVATPTDTAKSRRVSFSRRTGVAEFVTNEATTTWKNFYEEHNKTLESSGNDSEVKPPRPSVGHIGKRIFDQQFQEVEAVDLISTLDDGRGSNIETSINNVNFAEQLASLECTSNGKLTAPHHSFEFSAFTDPSKLFSDDFAISGTGELTDRISVNFSAIKTIGVTESDDLDEIERDLENAMTQGQNVVCPGPFRDVKDNLEYIEVDLNMTSIAVKNDKSDMSITDTIHSPKVQDISKSNSLSKDKISLQKDWVADKENILLNPYIAPKESANFAINEEPDKVLVFDGKRLTIQCDKENIPDKSNLHKVGLPTVASEPMPQRKTIVLNVNDDLPNFIEDPYVAMPQSLSLSMNMSDPSLCSDNRSINGDEIRKADEKRRTIVYGNDTGNISITQAIPSKIITDKRTTLVYKDDSADISVTQAILSNIILSEKQSAAQKRKTIVFEDNAGNISITQAIPSNIFINKPEDVSDKSKTIVYETDSGNISVTQAVASNLLLPANSSNSLEKRKTIVYDDEDSNISFTQAIPAKLILPVEFDAMSKMEKTIVYDTNAGDISVTQAIPKNMILPGNAEVSPGRRQTQVFEDDEGNISITQAMPSNILLHNQFASLSDKTDIVVFETGTGNVSVTDNATFSGRKPSISHQTNSEGVLDFPSVFSNVMPNEIDMVPEKRKTIVYEDDSGNISITHAISENLVLTENADVGLEKTQTIIFETNTGNISVTQAVATGIIEDLKNKDLNVKSQKSDPVDITEAESRNILIYDNTSSEPDDKTDTISDGDVEQMPGPHSSMSSIPQVQSEESNEVFMVEDSSDICIDEEKIDSDDKDQEKQNAFLLKEIASENAPQKCKLNEESLKRLYDTDIAYTTRTKPIPSEFNSIQQQLLNKCEMNKSLLKNQNCEEAPNLRDVFVYQADTESTKLMLKNNELNEKKLAAPISVSNDQISTDDSKQKLVLNESLTEPQTSTTSRGAEESDLTNKNKIDRQKSILNDLLDMSNASMEDGIDDKNIMVKVESVNNVDNTKVNTDSSDSLFYITKDSEDEVQTDSFNRDVESETVDNIIKLIRKSAKGEENPGVIKNIQKKLIKFKHKAKDDNKDIKKKATVNRHFEKVVSSDLVDNIQSQLNIKPYANTQLYTNIQPQANVQPHTITQPHVSPHPHASIQPHVSTQPPVSTQPHAITQPHVSTQPHVISQPQTNTLSQANIMPQANTQSNDSQDKNVHDNTSPMRAQAHNNTQLQVNNKSVKDIDSTKDLLEMLSQFTDREEEENPITLEDKPQINEQRQSVISKRASIVLSREDMLTNISMAQAVLQKSRANIGENESVEATSNQTINDTAEKNPQPKKSVRLSNDVVKTLRFDEDTYSEDSMHSESKSFTLKKTAFGEDSYMKESKANVIPTYLKDVSDGIKQLMSDLVKPMSDVMPFESGGIDKGFTKAPSTCSLQVQANLFTSSQIDLEREEEPTPDESAGWAAKIVTAAKKAVQMVTWDSPDSSSAEKVEEREPDVRPKPGKSSLSKSPDLSERASESGTDTNKDLNRSYEQTVPGRIIVFDHNNPLNNVIFAPIDYSEVHGYDPIKRDESTKITESDETVVAPRRSRSRVTIKENEREYDVNLVSTQYIMQNLSLPLHLSSKRATSPDPCSEKFFTSTSMLISNPSKPMSIDQSVDAPVVVVKDTEVNTVIFMKGNKELLEASSSLTLVDDALMQCTEDVESRSSSPNVKRSKKKTHSPVRVIYKIPESEKSTKLDSDVTSNDEECQYDEDKLENKPIKRDYTTCKHEKHKHCTLSNLEITPKPVVKMRRISESPHVRTVIDVNHVLPEHSNEFTKYKDSKKSSKSDVDQSSDSRSSSRSRKKSPRKTKSNSKTKKPGTSITVQQIYAEYHIEANIKHNLEKNTKVDVKSVTDEPLSEFDSTSQSACSPEIASSYTSSRNHIDAREVQSMVTTNSVSAKGKSFAMDWHPELINELSSKNLVTECESSVNVVAKIDMLPFMGSRDCEWESSGSDTWTFRLLHGRLRLNVRLAHRHDNASRTQVRADTPVVAVTLETVHQDKKNAAAVLCVRFASEAMRYFIGRGVTRAGDVPALLRRCAGVARVALRWGRAMHEAYMHLAYSVTSDGRLELKVANIPLRSVWEVTMQIAMVVDDAREVPWPGATDVRVSGVVTDYQVSDDEVQRVLAHVHRDWGNVPKTIWKIFKYLKHKARDDDLLL